MLLLLPHILQRFYHLTFEILLLMYLNEEYKYMFYVVPNQSDDIFCMLCLYNGETLPLS